MNNVIEPSQLTLTNGGIEFNFEDEGRVITVKGSTWSGKETIFVDGKPITYKRSFKRKVCQTFMVGRTNYEIEVAVINLISYEIHCTLIKNDVHVKTIKKKYQAKRFAQNELMLIAFGIGIFFFGQAVGAYLFEILKG